MVRYRIRTFERSGDRKVINEMETPYLDRAMQMFLKECKRINRKNDNTVETTLTALIDDGNEIEMMSHLLGSCYDVILGNGRMYTTFTESAYI